MIRVSDYIVQQLVHEGILHVFMVTGRGTLFLTDSVAANNEIAGISLHHEQSAAFAAVAYSQYTGNPSACMVSTGCAGTNTLTGVLNAWQDGNPCVFISGQNKLNETSHYTGIPVRTYGQQETDLIPILDSITKKVNRIFRRQLSGITLNGQAIIGINFSTIFFIFLFIYLILL